MPFLPPNQQRQSTEGMGTCVENFVTIGRDVCEILERTDRHTDMLIAILRIRSADDVILTSCYSRARGRIAAAP